MCRTRRGLLENLGASPKVLNLGNDANPVVVGEIKSKRNPQKTILFYNHYDVQPPEPLGLWDSPPFEPRESEGKLVWQRSLGRQGRAHKQAGA